MANKVGPIVGRRSIRTWDLESEEIPGNSLIFLLAGQACHDTNKCNKTSAFPILQQYYTKFLFIFIIYSNENSLTVLLRPLEIMYQSLCDGLSTFGPELGRRLSEISILSSIYI